MRLTAQWKAEARPPASVTAADSNARPLDLGKWKAIVGNSPCDPRAIERRTASLDSYLRQVDRPSYLLPVLPLALSASLPACGSTCSSTHLRQVVAVPRIAASRALQQLLVPPPGQRLIYSDPSREAEGGAEGWPRTPRHAAGEEEEEEGSG